MGSSGELASADEPIGRCGPEAAGLESVSGVLTCRGAAQTSSPDSNANADLTSTCPETERFGTERDCSPGDCDKNRSMVLWRDGQCAENGGSECASGSEAGASNLEREVFPGEFGVGNLQNGDELIASELTSGIDWLDNPFGQMEGEDGMGGDGPLSDGIKWREETAHDPLVMEPSTEVNRSPISNGYECLDERKAGMECTMISEEEVLTPHSISVNEQMGCSSFESCADLVDEQVNDMAEVETDTCKMLPCPETNEMPTENATSSGNPDEASVIAGQRNASDLSIETVKEAVEEILSVYMDSPKLPPNETDRMSDNSCLMDSLGPAVMEKVQEDDRNATCLSSEEASLETMREVTTASKVEAGMCIQTASFQVNEIPLEDKTIEIPLHNHERMSNNVESITVSSSANEADFGYRFESITPNCLLDCDSLNKKKTIAPLSVMPAEKVSGIEDVNIEDMHTQVLPSRRTDSGTSENLHLSPLLGTCAPVYVREDSQGASAETDGELVEVGNAIPLDKVLVNGSQLLHLEENVCIAESLSDGSCSLQSCERNSTVKNCSSKSSSVLDVPNMIVTVATTSSVANDYLGEKDDERKLDSRSDCFPETESPVVVTSTSRRSGRANKSGRKTQAKMASRYSRKASKVAYHHEALEHIFKAATKKRTCCSKTPRSSAWGVIQNVSQHFEHMDSPGLEPAQSQGARKFRIGQGSRKQSGNQSGGISQVSKGNVGGSSNRIRLKVKMGKEVVMISEIVHPAASLGAFASPSCADTISDVAGLTNVVKEKKQLDCVDAKLDKGKSYRGNTLVNGETNLIVKDSAHDGGYCGEPTPVEIGSVGGTVEDRYLGSETSPDSEVINLIPEAHVSERHQEGAYEVSLDSSKSRVTREDVLDPRKGKKKDEVPRQSSCGRKDTTLSRSSSSKRRGSGVKAAESFNSGENFASVTSANRLSNSPSNTESLPLSIEADLAFYKGPSDTENGPDTFPGQDTSIGSIDLEHLKNNLLSSAKGKWQKQVKSSNSGRVSGGRSKDLNSTKSSKSASCKQKKDSGKSTSKSKAKERCVNNQSPCKAEDDALAGNGVRDADRKSDTGACMFTGDTSRLEIISNNVVEQQAQRNAWVRCDDCHKWRRIAAALADSIEDANSIWTCKDNLDKSFADCSIPQEMSNADINAELEISDYSCEEDDYAGNRNYKELKCSRPTVSQESSFIQIDSNKFLQRRRRTQTIDEIMVCHCKPSLDGKLGCGDECLNRMLNIECVQGTCPCGDLCSNQQFQKRKYAKLQWVRCGKKGYGLQLLEDVSKGDFIIEYVGEVLDIPAYEERQRDYAAKGHKHFYFMTLNGSEVIDACVKGNLGRFINHSCDPNCRTEKWMVNGEICIGLFAMRDIKKGEEVTFDYNYVRVFGAAAKKCVCGSPQCRGYIGGDLQSTETIAQGDSDDEFPEPVMLHEDGDIAYRFEDPMPQTVGESDMLFTGHSLEDKNEVIKELEYMSGNRRPASQTVSFKMQSGRSLDAEERPENAWPSKPHQGLSLHSKEVKSTPSLEIQQKISVEEDAPNLNRTDATEMSEPPSRSVSDEKGSSAGLLPMVKTPRSSSTVKKSKGSSSSQNVNKVQVTASKSQLVPVKLKKAIEGSSNGRFEAVQEKLNELLDTDGGISKRKDAAKGYLKLLLLTAASGDSGNGEAIQSNRDLSMILDGLLKTRSRVVLMDIINKNGLRMLHNIMKQYRRDFKKIPILRKLLKVLEFLAAREILTLEHINVGPPCPGMESFRESILSLTEHDDKQVHQIARNFRDRWIPRYLRKVGYADRDDGMNSLARGLNSNNFLSAHSNWRDTVLTRPVEATDCLHQPSVSATTSSATDNSSNDGGSTSGTRTRKRKTRWDSDTNPYLESLKRKESSLNTVENGTESNCDLEVPPGFSSPLDISRVAANGSSTAMAVDQSAEKAQYSRCPFDAVIGQPQERFKSQSAVSYGVPLLILQQFGTPQAGSIESWAIAPGMPFQPFPPLPPFPRDRKRRSPPTSLDLGTNSSNSLYSSADEKKPENLSPSSNGANLAESEVPCSDNQHMMPFKRLKGSSQDLGRRYFRQQKWNSAKPPPWVRSCWRNNSSRGGAGPVLNEQRSSENAIECNKLGRDEGSYQHMPQIQNHHH